MMHLLNIDQWSLSYGDHLILDQLSLTMQIGEVVSVLGSNGAGKSTLLKSILGLTESSANCSGDILIQGVSMRHQAKQARANIAYVPEQAAVYEHLSAIENVRYLLHLTGHKPSQADIQASLEKVGLQEQAWHTPCHSYSKGMKQKVMLAIALAKQAKLILLDEPNSGLDPQATEELNQLIIQCKQLDMGILVVTHDVLSAMAFSDQLLMLNNAKLSPISLNVEALNVETLKALYQST